MSNPDDYNEFTLEAFDYFYAGQFAEAEEKFRTAIAHSSTNAVAWMGYHRTLAKLGKDTDARSAIQRSLEINSNDSEAWFCLASFLDEKNLETSTALDAYHRGLELAPEEGEKWRELAILYKKSGSLPKSEEVIRGALELSPDNQLHLIILEWNLRLQGRIDEADNIKAQIETIDAEEKRRQEEFDREIDEAERDAMIINLDDCDGLPKEEKAESDDGPLIPNPPLKTNISGFFDEDVEEFEGSLFGNVDDEDSKDTSKSDKNDADEIDAALALELFGPDDDEESED